MKERESKYIPEAEDEVVALDLVVFVVVKLWLFTGLLPKQFPIFANWG